MRCLRKAALGSKAATNALGGDRGSAHSRWNILARWRIDVWRGAETPVGEEDARGRAESDSVGGEFFAGMGEREECFGGDGQRDEVGREAAEYLWVCGGRSLRGFAGE